MGGRACVKGWKISDQRKIKLCIMRPVCVRFLQHPVWVFCEGNSMKNIRKESDVFLCLTEVTTENGKNVQMKNCLSGKKIELANKKETCTALHWTGSSVSSLFYN